MAGTEGVLGMLAPTSTAMEAASTASNGIQIATTTASTAERLRLHKTMIDQGKTPDAGCLFL